MENDYLIVSIGGNDIVLRPSLCTIWSIFWLTKCARKKNIKDGSAFNLQYFKKIFHSQV